MSHPQQQAVYPDAPRPEFAPLIPTDARSALDVGCSRGGFGFSLRDALGPDARLVGIEPVASQAEVARVGHEFDEVHTGYFPDVLADSEEKFDLICFNDVLEHIVDPWETLRAARKHLNPGGRIFAGIPNVQWLPNVLRLARGHWTYTEMGILDRTHVRFFTKSSMEDMFRQSGYRVISTTGVNSLADTGYGIGTEKWKTWARTHLARFAGNSQYLHFVVIATPRKRRPKKKR
ncbi:hypothetical protein GCM10011519_03320 [Marmoricola endophyticus]|uniref:Class I SAM-dependent methyltransferase n=1 Tax=Marmoricola endophyticus TaxID=2040280 RepID=A0A917BAT4_9ACTN|nr:class I SAM-dependent methyltransferase [Marmoricola endophyticus]GGF33193.1 hypothetical protein GCM10011519_03320 [Marmoricola endophyticus]